MCVHYETATAQQNDAIAAVLQADDPESGMRQLADEGAFDQAGAHLYPRRIAPVIANASSEGAGGLEVLPLTWGFPVPGHSDLVFNTRLESAAKGMALWRHPLEEGRALVCAHGFYERHATETLGVNRNGAPVKMPYRFEAAEMPLILMAALYQHDRFSIITTKPNACVRKVHNRMPLVLTPGEAARWLAGSVSLLQLADRSSILLTATAAPEAEKQPTRAASSPTTDPLFAADAGSASGRSRKSSSGPAGPEQLSLF